MKKTNLYLSVLLCLSLGMGIVEFLLNSKGEVVSDITQLVWGFTFLLLSILWANADTKNAKFEKPFDFDFLLYIFWPVAFPYYLYTTRGIEGILVLLGFFTIYLGPWLSGLVAYTYVYTG